MNYLTDSRIRNILAAIGVFLTIFLALKSWEVIRDLSSPKVDRPSISIMGEGKIFVKPDLGQINFSTVTEATTVAEAQEKATDSMNKVIQALKDKGVEEKDIRTSGYYINPKYDYGTRDSTMIYPPQGSPRIVGYTVNQSVDVKIRNLDKSGEIITAATGAGANQVGGLTFTTEDPSAIQAEARTKAIEDARKKAEELEQKLGIKLGKIISFSETGGPYPIYRDYAFGKGGGDLAMPQAAPTLPVGENEVVVNVYVVYQVK